MFFITFEKRLKVNALHQSLFMKKLLPLLFLLLSNVFIAVAGTNPPGGSIAYVTPMCHTSAQQNVIRNGLTLGGTFSSSPAGLTINAVTGDVFPIISQPGIYVVTYLVAPTQQDPAYMTNATVVIIPEVMPQFAQYASICSGSTAPSLPTTSTNGIAGTWSPATIDNTISATYTFTPNAGECAVPTVMNITVIPAPVVTISGPTTIPAGNSANITFIGTPNATVTYQYNSGLYQTITLDSSGIATITTPTLTTSTTICLISVSSNGFSNCTTVASGCAIINVTLANSQFDFKDLTYSPNPVEQVLNIKSSEAFKSIKVYNNLGQEVYQQNANAFDLNLDLGFLKTGNYFIKIASDKKHQVIQVIKK